MSRLNQSKHYHTLHGYGFVIGSYGTLAVLLAIISLVGTAALGFAAVIATSCFIAIVTHVLSVNSTTQMSYADIASTNTHYPKTVLCAIRKLRKRIEFFQRVHQSLRTDTMSVWKRSALGFWDGLWHAIGKITLLMEPPIYAVAHVTETYTGFKPKPSE